MGALNAFILAKFIDTRGIRLYNADLSSFLLCWIHKMLLAKEYTLCQNRRKYEQARID